MKTAVWMLGVVGLLGACGDGGGSGDDADEIDAAPDLADAAATIDAAPPPPDALAACPAEGSATASGTVGKLPELVITGSLALSGDGPAVVLHEAGASCDGPGSAGYYYIAFCSAPTTGEIQVVSPDAFDCSGDNLATIELSPPELVGPALGGGPALIYADGGTVTITDDLADCDIGSFTATFGADDVTGTFSALACPEEPV